MSMEIAAMRAEWCKGIEELAAEIRREMCAGCDDCRAIGAVLDRWVARSTRPLDIVHILDAHYENR